MPETPHSSIGPKVRVEPLDRIELVGALAAVRAVAASVPDGAPGPLTSVAEKFDRALSEEQPAPSLGREAERLEEIAMALSGIGRDADAAFLRELDKRLSSGGQGEADRLSEAEAILRECDSPDGFCGEMPGELRDRIQIFLGRLATCPTCERLEGVLEDGRFGRHQVELEDGWRACPGSLQSTASTQPVPSCLSEEGVREKLLGEVRERFWSALEASGWSEGEQIHTDAIGDAIDRAIEWTGESDAAALSAPASAKATDDLASAIGQAPFIGPNLGREPDEAAYERVKALRQREPRLAIFSAPASDVGEAASAALEEVSILDLAGEPICVGGQVLSENFGTLSVTGFSTSTPNESGATLFAVETLGEEEMRWHLQPTGDPSVFRTDALRATSTQQSVSSPDPDAACENCGGYGRPGENCPNCAIGKQPDPDTGEESKQDSEQQCHGCDVWGPRETHPLGSQAGPYDKGQKPCQNCVAFVNEQRGNVASPDTGEAGEGDGAECPNCGGTRKIFVGSMPDGIAGNAYAPCGSCPGGRADLSGKEQGGEHEPNDDEWCCDSCGLIAPIEAAGWEQTPQDDAGVTVEFCPHCRRHNPCQSCGGTREIYVGSGGGYGSPGSSYAPCGGCPDCRAALSSSGGDRG
jgi:hypothetical protein